MVPDPRGQEPPPPPGPGIAFTQGACDAYGQAKAGRPLVCPYRPGSEAAAEWARGVAAMRRDLEGRP